MAVHAETCENCGATIGALEEAHLWNDHVVCAACLARLPSLPGDPPRRCEGCGRLFADKQPTFSLDGKNVCLDCINAAGLQGVELAAAIVGWLMIIGGASAALTGLMNMDEFACYRNPVPIIWLCGGLSALPAGVAFLLGARIAQTLRAIADKRKRL